ncbi:MAG TPA: ABC transporter substrate-binding protein, partial [Candidatus Paceibacterota bacterium]|nr:ABC transporter substrate-binding protein [Candidatus Paceibacterota bacterium]
MDKKILLAIVVAAIVVGAVVAVAVLYQPESRTGTVYYDTSITVPNMKAALATGLIDGYISWEPFVSDAVMDDTGEVLMWSSEMMPNHPCCVVVASTNFIGTEDGPDLTKRFLKAHMEATEWMLSADEDHNSADYTLLVTLAQEFTLKNSSVVSAAMS